MGRPLRAADGNRVYHVLNRANRRAAVFDKPGDYEAFERVLQEAVARFGTRLLAYCLMPNHWHLVVWPSQDGELSAFAGWLSLTHAQRWHAHRHTAGSGHVYQGRFKSFPVQDDDHLLTVLRYVERNPARAGLVDRAEAWRWSSVKWRLAADPLAGSWLCPWPTAAPSNWLDWINQPLTAAEEQAIKRSARRGSPLGEAAWVRETAAALGLQSTLHPLGRPRKSPVKDPHGQASLFADDVPK
jgi:putative transposase